MNGLNTTKLKEVLILAAQVVVTRHGDVSVEGVGDLATTDINSLIQLDYALAELFELPSDDVDFDNISIIQSKLRELVEDEN